MKEEPNREEILFNKARQLPSPEARAVFLAKACGEDTALRQRIEARLKAAERAEGSTAQPPVSAGASSSIALSPPGGEQPGDPPAQHAAVVVRRLGNYQLLKKLGEGGMGVVYKARDLRLKRLVALKVMRPAGQLVRRFKLEAQALARLEHPNIVPIYEAGEDGGKHYFSMRLVTGGSLTQQSKRFVADLKAAVRLVAKVARAVHHAHKEGILHRDLKPSNILIDADGEPHVTDFGLAKLIEHKADLTQTGVILGTPDYMAPEQAQGKMKDLGKPADIFSLGIILYELITGRHPFHQSTPLLTLRQVVDANPERPSGINAQVDEELEAVCLKCLEKDPERRYESAAALAEDLEGWLKQEPTQGSIVDSFKPMRVNPVRFPIRFLLADDHTLVRAGIRALLEKLPGVEVTGEASDGREVIDLIKAHQPDVVLMDISMPGLNGLQALARITRDFPQVRVIILSMHHTDECVLQALKSGAAGYLLKRAATAELAAALTSVVGGEIYLSREIASRFLKQFTLEQIARSNSPLEQLTSRQREILQLITEGQTTKGIASILKVSERTVEYHRAKLMAALRIFDIPGLVLFALRAGLISPESCPTASQRSITLGRVSGKAW